MVSRRSHKAIKAKNLTSRAVGASPDGGSSVLKWERRTQCGD